MLNFQYIAKKRGGRSTNLGKGITKHKKTTRGTKKLSKEVAKHDGIKKHQGITKYRRAIKHQGATKHKGVRM
jgi:hypothetical protein